MKLQDLHPAKLVEAKDDVTADVADDSVELEKGKKPEDQVEDEVEQDDGEEEQDDGEEDDEDVGTVVDREGYEKSKRDMYAFGKTRPVTILTKNETLGGLKLTIQYVINPSTGAWVLQACLAGQSQEDMVEFGTGEDSSSLVKSLKKKRKITAHQAVQYLNPPADGSLKKDDEQESADENGDDDK
jgi:hypothetical protein